MLRKVLAAAILLMCTSAARADIVMNAGDTLLINFTGPATSALLEISAHILDGGDQSAPCQFNGIGCLTIQFEDSSTVLRYYTSTGQLDTAGDRVAVDNPFAYVTLATGQVDIFADSNINGSHTEATYTLNPAVAPTFPAPITAVPEPATWVMALLGFLAFGLLRRLRTAATGFLPSV